MQFAQRLADSMSACRSRLKQIITETDTTTAASNLHPPVPRSHPFGATAMSSADISHSYCAHANQPKASSEQYVIAKVSARRRESEDDGYDGDEKSRKSRPRSLSRSRAASDRSATAGVLRDMSPSHRSPSHPLTSNLASSATAIGAEHTLSLCNGGEASASRLCSRSSETGDERPKRAVRVCESVCSGAMQRSLQMSAARRGDWKTAKAASLIAGGRGSPLRAAPINENEVFSDALVRPSKGGCERPAAGHLKRLTSDARTDSVFDDCQLQVQQPQTTTAATTTSTSCSTSSSYGSRNSSVSSRSPLSLSLPRPAFPFDVSRASAQLPTDMSSAARERFGSPVRSLVNQLRGTWSASACSSPNRSRLPCPSEFLQRTRPSNASAIRLEELDPALYVHTPTASKSLQRAGRETSLVGQVQLAIQFERDLRELHVHLYSVQLGANASSDTAGALDEQCDSGSSPARGLVTDGFHSPTPGCPEADSSTHEQCRPFRAIQSAHSTPRHRQSITPSSQYQSLLASVLQHQQAQARTSAAQQQQQDLQRSWLLMRATLDPSGISRETAARRPTPCRSRRRTSTEFGAVKAATGTGGTGPNEQCSPQGARVRFEESESCPAGSPPREREHKPLDARRSANESVHGELHWWTCSWNQTLEFPLNPSSTAIGALVDWSPDQYCCISIKYSLPSCSCRPAGPLGARSTLALVARQRAVHAARRERHGRQHGHEAPRGAVKRVLLLVHAAPRAARVLARFLSVRSLVLVSPAQQLLHVCVPSLSRGKGGEGEEEMRRAGIDGPRAHCRFRAGGECVRGLCAPEQPACAACRVWRVQEQEGGRVRTRAPRSRLPPRRTPELQPARRHRRRSLHQKPEPGASTYEAIRLSAFATLCALLGSISEAPAGVKSLRSRCFVFLFLASPPMLPGKCN